jgi:FAD/FMN-containing dehydrogenase
LECVARGAAIARGNGRAYGDSAVNSENTLRMRHFNHMIDFDPGSGQLTAEAGVLLGDIIAAFLPRGWFPAATPGTKYVTLGGMIAADVHGKNHHHYGSFGNCVDWIDLVDAHGNIRRCSREENPDLFQWSLGGMGLTGIILRAAIRLAPIETAWIRQTTIPTANLEAALLAFDRTREANYSVAWIDCLSKGRGLGRSLLMLGEHARRHELDEKRQQNPLDTTSRRRIKVPIEVPSGTLNNFSARAFNAYYYWNGVRRAGSRLVDWDSYFYPLDSILGWNRIYGRRGFMQFQCVLPLHRSEAGLRALLEAISSSGTGSFLAVLKRLGDQAGGLSFPMEGYTLALDFPVNERSLNLMSELDEIAIDHGGRFYLAKDSRMSADTLRRSDARAHAFARMRETSGLRAGFQSSQSQRLGL